MSGANQGQGVALTWTVEPGAVLLHVHGTPRPNAGGALVIPLHAATVRAMLAAASGSTAPDTSPRPLIPHGHPHRAYAEGLYQWLSEPPARRSVIAASLDADARERWAQVVWCWLHDATQHPSAGAISPLPDPLPRPVGVQVDAEQPGDDTADRPAGLDGWPQPDPSESAALWNIRRVRQLLSEMAERDPIALKGEYPTDLRDWVDRLAEVIRHVKRLEQPK